MASATKEERLAEPCARRMPSTVLLVEDDPATRAHLSGAIRGCPELVLVGEESTLAGGLARLLELAPDVLLTDLGLPDGSGLALVREAAAGGRTQPLVITVFGDEEHLLEAIRAGAVGYLLKSDGHTEITAAVLEVLAGGSPISPAIARDLLDRFRGLFPEPRERAPALSDRELEVLRHIVKGFTYDEIAGLLELAPTTVATHVRNIYRKLAVHSRSEAAYEAIQTGLIRLDE